MRIFRGKALAPLGCNWLGLMKQPRTRVTKYPPKIRRHWIVRGVAKSMIYLQSFLSGVRRIEQWDRFLCPWCRGVFEFRHRTSKLRVMDYRVNRFPDEDADESSDFRFQTKIREFLDWLTSD